MHESLTYDDVLLEPQPGVLKNRENADISSFVVPGLPIEVPILSANMPSVTGPDMVKAIAAAGGYGVMHRFNSTKEALADYFETLDCKRGVSLGLKDGISRAQRFLHDANPVFFLDVAHGHHVQVIDFVKKFRSEFGDEPYLVVGNIATHRAVGDLTDAGKIDGFKVGVGPGAACTTREVTGFGVGQLTAIFNITWALDFIFGTDDERPTLIADGGIKSSGDIVKALAAGADTVMVGRLFAGCNEAPEPGLYYGNASKHVNGHNAPEGVLGRVERTGSVKDTMKRLAWGIRSGISYAGATNLKELRENAVWQRVSSFTAMESAARV